MYLMFVPEAIKISYFVFRYLNWIAVISWLPFKTQPINQRIKWLHEMRGLALIFFQTNIATNIDSNTFYKYSAHTGIKGPV